MEPERKEVLSFKVYKALKKMIAEHRFTPGARINVERVSRELKVSRIPVWEAIRRLEQEGLLQHIPNRGVFMVEMSLERAYELFEVRRALERLVAALAANRIDRRGIRKLKKCLDSQREAILKGDVLGYSRLDLDFHSIICAATRNKSLQELMESVSMKMQPVSLQILPALPDFYQDHQNIVDALESRDPEQAEKAFDHHNVNVLDWIRREIDKAAEKEAMLRRSTKSQRSRKKEVVQGLR